MPALFVWLLFRALVLPRLCSLTFSWGRALSPAVFLLLVASMSLWCVASLAALAFGFAMLYPCIVMGCATGVFRALRYVLFVSTQHEYSLAYAVSLVNTSPWICVFGPPAFISAALDFVLPWLSQFHVARSLPVEGSSFSVNHCRGRTCPALSIELLHLRRLHRHTAPKCPKQPDVRWVPFGGFPIEFDALKGFAGEGPVSPKPQTDAPKWSPSTANIGSLKTSTFWQSDFD